MKWINSIFILLAGITSVHAQQWTVSYLGGRIKKHSDNLRYTSPGYAQGVEVSAKWISHSNWFQYFDVPYIDITSFVLDFGSPTLGRAAGIMPGLHFNTSIAKVPIRTSLLWGLGYASKSYDYTNNASNNALGSAWNNAVRIRTSIELRPVSLGINLYHFSNGGVVSPNLGINLFMLNASYALGGELRKGRSKEFFESRDSMHRKWGIHMEFTHGLHQSAVPGGPTYAIRSLSLGSYYAKSTYFRFLGGFEMEYNDAVYAFFINDFTEEKKSKSLARELAIYLGSEFCFGNIAFVPKWGLYLPVFEHVDDRIHYFKLETIYYPLGRKYKASPYIGLAMKSHKAVAQYMGLVLGVRW